MSSVMVGALTAVAVLGVMGASAAGDAAAGKTLYTSSGCGGCHTLADAGATGKSASNLDTTKPSFDATVSALTNPPSGMPKGSLSDQQIQDLAAYIVEAAGKQAGGGGDTSRTVNVTLKKKKWKITLSPKQVSAGLVTFKINNRSKRWHQVAITRVSSTSKKSSAQSSTTGWAGTVARSSGSRFTRCRVGKSGLIRNICKIKAGHARTIYRTLQPGKYKVINTRPACLYRCVKGRYKYGKGRSATLTVTEAPPAAPGLSAEAQAFVDAGCGGCHTLADARTSSTVASSLDIGKPSLNTVVDVVTNGMTFKFQAGAAAVPDLEEMPAYNASLSAEQIQSMASYISRVTGGGDGSGQPAGRQNVLRTGCASCHTLADIGGTASDPGGSESYSNLDIAKPNFTTAKSAVEASPSIRHMPKYKAESVNPRVLNDQELADVETYISNITGGSTQPNGGRQTFLVRGCSSCHTLADAGGVGEEGTNLDIGKPNYTTTMRILDHNMGTSGTATPKRWGLTPGMPSRKTYPTADKQSIATYIADVTGGASQDPASGRQLSLVGGCGGCHVLADTGGRAMIEPTGPNLDEVKPSSFITDLVLTNGIGPQPPTDTLKGMPMYLSVPSAGWDELKWGPIDSTDVDEKFSDAEIDAVAAFIRDATGGPY